MQTVIKGFSTKKTLGPDDFIGKLHERVKLELITILKNSFKKIEEEGMLLNSNDKANITLKSEPNKDITIKL